jgi:hypothetical protein
VVVTDSTGSEAILKRIRELFNGREETLQEGLTLSISCRPIEAIERCAGESADNYLEKASDQIQAMMNGEISLRMAVNGQ